jgi:hypothetical protein
VTSKRTFLPNAPMTVNVIPRSAHAIEIARCQSQFVFFAVVAMCYKCLRIRLSPLITKQTCHSIAHRFGRVFDHNVIAVQIDIDLLVS